jgi:Asp-tRNA(Asn)/Glu-tRNA(Gln) amidotransferase A subunit family amidase
MSYFNRTERSLLIAALVVLIMTLAAGPPPAAASRAPALVQKVRRTLNGIFTTASSATGLPALSAGTNFQRAKAFAA